MSTLFTQSCFLHDRSLANDVAQTIGNSPQLKVPQTNHPILDPPLHAGHNSPQKEQLESRAELTSSADQDISLFQSHIMSDSAKKDPFELPSKEVLKEIERKQNERAKAIRERKAREAKGNGGGDEERTSAAEMIQRNYRGHRERRALKGFGLDSGTRWMEVSCCVFCWFVERMLIACIGFKGW